MLSSNFSLQQKCHQRHLKEYLRKRIHIGFLSNNSSQQMNNNNGYNYNRNSDNNNRREKYQNSLFYFNNNNNNIYTTTLLQCSTTNSYNNSYSHRNFINQQQQYNNQQQNRQRQFCTMSSVRLSSASSSSSAASSSSDNDNNNNDNNNKLRDAILLRYQGLNSEEVENEFQKIIESRIMPVDEAKLKLLQLFNTNKIHPKNYKVLILRLEELGEMDFAVNWFYGIRRMNKKNDNANANLNVDANANKMQNVLQSGKYMTDNGIERDISNLENIKLELSCTMIRALGKMPKESDFNFAYDIYTRELSDQKKNTTTTTTTTDDDNNSNTYNNVELSNAFSDLHESMLFAVAMHKKTDISEKIMQYMQSNHHKITSKHLSLIIGANVSAKDFLKAKDIFERSNTLQVNGIQKTHEMYHLVLYGLMMYCKERRPKVNYSWKNQRSEDLKKNLIEMPISKGSPVTQNAIEYALDLYREMDSIGLIQDFFVYKTIIELLLREDNMKTALLFLFYGIKWECYKGEFSNVLSLAELIDIKYWKEVEVPNYATYDRKGASFDPRILKFDFEWQFNNKLTPYRLSLEKENPFEKMIWKNVMRSANSLEKKNTDWMYKIFMYRVKRNFFIHRKEFHSIVEACQNERELDRLVEIWKATFYHDDLKRYKDSMFLFRNDLVKSLKDGDLKTAQYLCNLIISLHCKIGDWQIAFERLSEVVHRGLHFDPELVASVIMTCAENDQIHLCLDIVKDMDFLNIKPSVKALNSILVACGKARDYTTAIEIFDSFTKYQLSANSDSFAGVIESFADTDDTTATKLYTAMIENGIEPNCKVDAAMVIVLCSVGKWTNATLYFDQILSREGKDQNYILHTEDYNSLMDAFFKCHQYSTVLKLYDRMIANRVKLDRKSYTIMIETLKHVNWEKKALQLFTKAEYEGHFHECYKHDDVFDIKHLSAELAVVAVEHYMDIQKQNIRMTSKDVEFEIITKYKKPMATKQQQKSFEMHNQEDHPTVNDNLIGHQNIFSRRNNLNNLNNDQDKNIPHNTEEIETPSPSLTDIIKDLLSKYGEDIEVSFIDTGIFEVYKIKYFHTQEDLLENITDTNLSATSGLIESYPKTEGLESADQD